MTVLNEIFQFSFNQTKYEHDQLMETWTRLDDKAMATASVSGFFIAAVFVFLQSSLPNWTVLNKAAFTCVVLLLGLTIFLAVSVMLVRKSSLPPTAISIATEVDGIKDQNVGEIEERFDRLIASVIKQWISINCEVKRVLDQKSNLLRKAQISLLFSALCVVALTVFLLFATLSVAKQ